MINIPEAAQQILDIAGKKNCQAQVTIVDREAREISLRKGEIERLLTSIALSTGIRLFKDNKVTTISFSGNNFENMEEKIGSALENLEYLGKDETRRILAPAEFKDVSKELDLDDGGYDSIDVGKITEMLKSIEKSALEVSSRIITSEPVDFSGSRTGIHLFSSAGLSKSYSKSYYSFIYEAVAEKDGLKETDYWYEDGHHFSDLPDARGIADIGRIAAERAIKRLGGDNIPSGEYPVVFTSRTAGSLLQLIYYAVCGEEVLVRNSFMVDKLGKEIFPSYITIMDDPVMPRHIGSYPFDGEGMAGISKAVVEKGVLSTYLHNSYSAAKLGMELTGNASRGIASLPGIASGNFYLESGKGSMDDLVLEMQNGLIVEDIFTSGMNDVTGDFSYGCSGFLVEKGKIVAPVKEITIAGNVLDLFKNIIAIADDNQYKDAVSSPSFLVSKLAVAGA